MVVLGWLAGKPLLAGGGREDDSIATALWLRNHTSVYHRQYTTGKRAKQDAGSMEARRFALTYLRSLQHLASLTIAPTLRLLTARTFVSSLWKTETAKFRFGLVRKASQDACVKPHSVKCSTDDSIL